MHPFDFLFESLLEGCLRVMHISAREHWQNTPQVSGLTEADGRTIPLKTRTNIIIDHIFLTAKPENTEPRLAGGGINTEHRAHG